MGYTTTFEGGFKTDRQVDTQTFLLLKGLGTTRRMKRFEKIGKQYGVDGEFYVKDDEEFVKDYNIPPSTQPGLWCQWLIQDDAQTIEWDGNEKFYYYVEWLEYIITKILEPKGYILNGEVKFQGEEPDDFGKIVVENNVVQNSDECRVYGYSQKSWSASGNWSGISSHAEFFITKNAIKTLGINGLMIGGLFTLDAEKIGKREYRAQWVEQSRGFELKVIKGFIIRGYHIVEVDINRARKLVELRRKKAASMIKIKRSSNVVKIAKHRWVTVADSISAGNCEAGTKNFINRHNLQYYGAIRGDVLLKLEDSEYTRRAILTSQHQI